MRLVTRACDPYNLYGDPHGGERLSRGVCHGLHFNEAVPQNIESSRKEKHQAARQKFPFDHLF